MEAIIPAIQSERGTLINATPDQARAEGVSEGAIQTALSQKDWAALRARRNELLAASEHTQSRDTPLSAAMREQWAVYRKALRDLPATLKAASIDPAAALTELGHWPTPPEG